MTAPYEPVVTDQVLRAFPAHVTHLMPAPDDPMADAEHVDPITDLIFQQWFFKGVDKASEFQCWSPLDGETAFFHVHCVLGSYQHKHEHKERAARFLIAQFFGRILLNGQEFFIAQRPYDPTRPST